MRGVSKARLMCIKCQREFTDRTGSTYQHGFFRCAACQPKPKEKRDE